MPQQPWTQIARVGQGVHLELSPKKMLI
jgi:hypothetical protein